MYEDRTRKIFSFPDEFLLTGNDSDTIAFEAQNLLRIGAWQVTSGLGYVDEEDNYFGGINVSIDTSNLYVYSQWQPPTITSAFKLCWTRLV